MEFTAAHPPRLFTSRKAAKMALRFWLAGRLHRNVSNYFGEINETLHLEPIQSRKASDCVIVPVQIMEV